ncbi:MAG: hypothetical protein M3Q80_00995 [bacterium]|nr:hypothetical protein [bacterium]
MKKIIASFLSSVWRVMTSPIMGPVGTKDSDEVSLVTHHYEDGGIGQYFIPSAHVRRYIKAVEKLHRNPGINPHSGNKTAQIVGPIEVSRTKFIVGDFYFRSTYWWSSPSLQSHDPNGALILEPSQFSEHYAEMVTIIPRLFRKPFVRAS